MKYDKEKIAKSLDSIDKVIENDKKIVMKYYQLKYTLLRIQRALNDTFWFDELSFEDKVKAFKEEKEIYLKAFGKIPSHFEGYPLHYSIKEFGFIKKDQWKKDKEQLKKETLEVKINE